MHSPDICVATLQPGGLLNPPHALVTYLVPDGGGDGVPPQDDLAQIFLPLDQISPRPLPVLLDAGLVDGELWSFVAGDGAGARGQGKCKEKGDAMIHDCYWPLENESKATLADKCGTECDQSHVTCHL